MDDSETTETLYLNLCNSLEKLKPAHERTITNAERDSAIKQLQSFIDTTFNKTT